LYEILFWLGFWVAYFLALFFIEYSFDAMVRRQVNDWIMRRKKIREDLSEESDDEWADDEFVKRIRGRK